MALGDWLGSGGTGNFGDSGGGFDWGGTVKSIFGGGGGGVDYGSLLGTTTGAASSGGSGWLNTVKNLFGGSGGQQGGSTLTGDLFKGILSGVGASADAKGQLEMAREVTKVKGLEDRKTTAYEAELLDFYKQRDNHNKFRALDQYGQFSRVSKFAPQFQRTYAGPVNPGTAPPAPKA